MHAADACASVEAPPPSFRAAVSRVAPSVVELVVLRDHEDAPPEDDAAVLLAPAQLPLPGGAAIDRAVSSGFFLGSDGDLLTTAHSVEGSRSIRVYTATGQALEARVVGIDAGADLALLHVTAGHAPGVDLASATQPVCAGDWVAAVGAPFGFAQSASVGVVSSYPRFVPIASDYPLIQTDAAVNPGNSGGPLVDAAGRVVGINTMIFSDAGGSVGMSFALPIQTALRVVDALRAGRAPWRSAIGVHTQPLTPNLARAFGMPEVQGTLVAEVRPGSPAAAAGLVPGNVVAAIDGQPASLAIDDVPLATGRTLRLTVWRQGRHEDIDVRLEPPTNAAAAKALPPAPRLGLELAPARTAGDLHRGVLVEAASGPALIAGIVPGDRVCGIGGRAVASRDDFDRTLAAAPPGDGVALLVCRGSRAGYLVVQRR
ncbi:trypsin-like peptidase domain-containing protein [Ramlibacter sp. MMS24-I3-19]|uniref:trypsin-like peptidase domain-containing protein n=1 Tax=Ramlibacter sp. MMS24-I3-19 TaxID=3416606 RepID=UPI003D040674